MKLFGCALSLVAITLLAACGSQLTAPAVASAARHNATGLNHTDNPRQPGSNPAYNICTGSSSNVMLPRVTMLSSGSSGPSRGLTPANIQAAYNLPSPISGNGQLIAVVEVCDNPNVASDLATYRSAFGLPPAQLLKFNEHGRQGNYPAPNIGGALASDIDVEMISATCPNCAIDLIESNNENAHDFQTAEATAIALGAHIITNSWGCGAVHCLDEQYFNKPGITYVDMGTFTGSGPLIYPAAFERDVAVGGTYLSPGGHGSRGWVEKIFPHYGGGCSTEPKPPWQHDAFCSGRAANDVSIVAWNMAIYATYHLGGWASTGGTGIPQGLIAGIFALAGNASKQQGGRTFWLHEHLKDLYRVRCQGECLNGRYSYADGWGSPNGIGAF